ncbi:c-type cytochrome [Lichenicola sp.]|uniref:c-type cytochrome n=1 Tax=Lichenicola sp. TaxID=2804529 RepID=UPI003B004197
MSAERPPTGRDRWAVVSAAIIAGVAGLSIAAGFVWFPTLMSSDNRETLWQQICGAAGLVRSYASVEPVVGPTVLTSQVVMTPQMLAAPTAEDIGRGATFALRCTVCHGARGLSDANSPNLAGQYRVVLYKQIRDFASGARPSSVMGPLVAHLGDPEMRDLAAYYAYLPALPPYHPVSSGPMPAIVSGGAPMRGIAPCGACHGGLANKTGSAWLEGQPERYLLAQLHAFASGDRHNDISRQMRNVAHDMTPVEMAEAAAYYANQPLR